MGFSATLLKKEWCVLSLEIDTHLSIEMSTGFLGNAKATTGTRMVVTVGELEEVMTSLELLLHQVKKSKICKKCAYINHFENSTCDCCDEVLVSVEGQS